ncbi:GNAT family N-acetyltransferase [Antribacter gilvus]|uniref:GNAT family N-acetyltransferase n=1 Tax=Antribacter gilvus TaxID=2304675 RepID=UPI000F7B07F9|nr:GNAT family N-acetyltransferase [Antribacter gilvus]
MDEPGLENPFAFSGPITTARLSLRPMRESDVDSVHAYQSREDVCRYLLFEPRDHARVAEMVADYVAHDRLERTGDYLQIAVERRSDGAFLGDVYFQLKSVPNRTGEIGWTFHPDHHGSGYATEAARAVLGLAFGVLGLHRVVAELDPRNDASVAMCRRLGLREEAHFVRDLWFKGDWADTGVYAILAEEFAPPRG